MFAEYLYGKGHILQQQRLTKGLKEGLYEAGAVSEHSWIHVDAVCSWNWRQGKRPFKMTSVVRVCMCRV